MELKSKLSSGAVTTTVTLNGSGYGRRWRSGRAGGDGCSGLCDIVELEMVPGELDPLSLELGPGRSLFGTISGRVHER